MQTAMKCTSASWAFCTRQGVRSSAIPSWGSSGCPLKCNSKLGIVPAGTTKKFEWSTNKDGSLKTLDQNMTIGRGESRTHVKASYDSTKNQTTIHSDAKNPSKVTLPGLVLMRLATDAGGVVIEYTNPATGTTVVFTP